MTTPPTPLGPPTQAAPLASPGPRQPPPYEPEDAAVPDLSDARIWAEVAAEVVE